MLNLESLQNLHVSKIVVTGTSGCGKTTLGEHLSTVVNAKCIDLDELYWLPGWQKRDDEEFLHKIKEEISKGKWVVCGNYSRARDEIWSQAEMIIWLDLPLRVCLWRALKRSLSRALRRQSCCNGNYETIGRLIGKDSILLWIWNTYPRRKKAYTEFFAIQADGSQLFRLKSNEEINAFIKHFARYRRAVLE